MKRQFSQNVKNYIIGIISNSYAVYLFCMQVTDVSGANNALDDANGHGTHVCGTAGSMTYGVAKNVKLFSARISNDPEGASDSAYVFCLSVTVYV